MITEIGKKTYLINEYGLDCIYLIEGSRRTLVIDTGAGYCGLKLLIGRLTPLPFDVALTHGHIGHAGGIRQFDDVYIHPEDIALAKSITIKSRAEYGSHSRNSGNENVWGDFSNDFTQWNGEPTLRQLYDGLIFELGGRCVRTLYTPGHTTGSCSFIDDKSHICFTGDACNPNLKVNTFISTTVRGLFNIRKHIEEFDQIFGGHIGNDSIELIRSIQNNTLFDCIMACRCILEKTFKSSPYSSQYSDLLCKLDSGSATVLYNPERLWEPGENQAPIPIGM